MATCVHRLGGLSDGLQCTRLDDHDPAAVGGHTYTSESGVPNAAKEEA